MASYTRRTFVGTAIGGVVGSVAAGTATATSGVTVREDVVYRTTDSGDLLADVYLPPGDGPHPTVVWVHGGGWTRGSKEWLARKAADAAGAGFAGVSIDYRLAPEHTYPDPVVDVGYASTWVDDVADEYGFAPDSTAYVGRSAGAHLAALAAVTNYGQVESVAGFYGPYEFRPLIREDRSDPAVAAFLGAPASEVPGKAIAASPTTHATADDPPHLLLHGTDDDRVPYRSSLAYREALASVGVRADLFTAPGGGHGFDRTATWYGPTFEELTAFLGDTIA